MKRKGELVGLLLAAGRSSRFGGDKLLHPLADGIPMVLASANALRAAVPRTVAVIRPDHRVLADLLRGHGISTVLAEHADSGMGASLAAGIEATANASGWVVALGDMPFIRPPTVARIADTIERGANLAAPFYNGQRGHPVGFACALREELLGLGADFGARALLQRHADQLARVECDDPGVLLDIDRREALATLAQFSR